MSIAPNRLDELDQLDKLRDIERAAERAIERRAQGLTEQLSVATAARRSHRLRVIAIPLALGISSGLAGMLLFLVSESLSTRANVGVCLVIACEPLTLLSAPANDARAAVGAAVLFIILMAITQVVNLSAARYYNAALEATPVCGMRYQLQVRLHVYLVIEVTVIGVTAVLLSRLAQWSGVASRCAPLGWLRPITTRQLMLSIWRAQGIYYLVLVAIWGFYMCAFVSIVPGFDTTTHFAEMLSRQFLVILCSIFCLR
jgi:hypothetical protein